MSHETLLRDTFRIVVEAYCITLRANEKMNYSLSSWFVMAEFVVVELPLAVVSWAAVTNVFYISPGVALVWRILATFINLLAWLALVYLIDPETNDCAATARTRGSALSKAHTAYFVVPLLTNLLMVALWIPHRVQFSGFSPLNFTTNIDAFHVLRSIETVGLLLFVVILNFWFYEARILRLHVRITKSSKKSNSTSAVSSQ